MVKHIHKCGDILVVAITRSVKIVMLNIKNLEQKNVEKEVS